ncbi:MAG: hypothetical protein ABIN80_30100 [Dyadobacter sp.]|uniref:hypothetical protein n=1 Tax=Dyadobacter sp. TaxID=1914288 RepID=UPI003267F337
MRLQYISNSKGVTTGVYIPISEWNALKSKYLEIEQEETSSIPDWHKDIVLARLENYQDDLSELLDFETTMDDLDRDLNFGILHTSLNPDIWKKRVQ